MGTCRPRAFEPTLEIERASVVIQTDGGVREGDYAAAAWIINLWAEAPESYTYEPLMVHGIYVS